MFLSPPWGGPSYKSIESFTLDFLKPKDGYVLDAIFHTQGLRWNFFIKLPWVACSKEYNAEKMNIESFIRYLELLSSFVISTKLEFDFSIT